MSYKLNKTDGTLLVDLIDGIINTDATDLVLVGRNYTGYGEYVNENIIKLLENFANTSAPGNPLEGQLWWDKVTQRLKIYDGVEWKSNGIFVQQDKPQMVAGDLWINNLTDQLYFYDGTGEPTLVGPVYSSTQGTSGWVITNILDIQSRSRTVAQLYIGGQLVAVFSPLTFTPAFGFGIEGINGDILQGINIINDNFKFHGTATSSNGLITETGVVKNASQFLPSDANGTTTGTLTIQNSGGLTIGLAQNNVQKVVAQSFVIENQLRDHDMKLRVRSSLYGSLIVDAVTIKAAQARVGIFKPDPEYTLDVTGDLRITGDLRVEGNTTYIETSTLRVEDKNIELGLREDSTLSVDADIDEGGIILKSLNGDKDFVWKNENKSWYSSENLDLTKGKEYKINKNTVITETTIGTGVVNALGLERIGTLQYLDVDNVNIDGITITTTGSGLIIKSAGEITVADSLNGPQKITNLGAPTAPSDATTKNYVDTQIASEPVVFSMDVTGLSNDNIATVINSMFPASQKEPGTRAFIHCTSLAGAQVTGIQITVTQDPDNSGVLTQSKIAVDANGTLNESAVQDIAFSNAASGAVDIIVNRTLKEFEAGATAWTFVQDLPTGL